MTEPQPDSLGARVRRRREQLGLSQTQLAAGEVSTSYVSLVETGHRVPSEELLLGLARRLRTTPEHLRDGADPGEDPAVVVGRADDLRADGEAHEALLLLAGLDRRLLTDELADRADLVRGRCHEGLGQLATAVAVLAPLFSRAAAGRAGVDVCTTGISLVRSLLDDADVDGAARIGDAALTAAREQRLEGTTDGLRLAATTALAHYERGDLVHGAALVDRHLRLAEAAGDDTARGSLHWNAMLLRDALGDPDGALRHADAALDLLVDPAHPRDMAMLPIGVAWVQLRRDPPHTAAAVTALELVRPREERIGSPVDRATWHAAMSRARLLLGDPDGAADHARRAIAEAGDDVHLQEPMGHLCLGDALLAGHRPQDAWASYERAALQLELMQASRQATETWRDVAERLSRAGRVQEALQAFEHSLDSAGLRAGRVGPPLSPGRTTTID